MGLKNYLYLLLGLLASTAWAEQTKTVFNPFTGKSDYITSVSTWNFQGSGVSCTAGVCTFTGSGGSGGGALVNGATQYSLAYFSAPGSSTTLSGFPGVSLSTGGIIMGIVITSTNNVVFVSSSIASTATPTPPGDGNHTLFMITALAANAVFAVPSGVPANGNVLEMRIIDNGTARTLGWNAIYRASLTIALPTTTTISKTMYLTFIYNSVSSTWDFRGMTDGS